MGTNSQELVIRISGDVEKISEAFEKVEHDAKGMSEGLEKVGEVAKIAFEVLAVEVAGAVFVYGRLEKANNSLIQSLQNQGLASDELIHKYQEQAEHLEHLTGVEKAKIVSGQAQLQQYVGQRAISDELTKATLDLAAAKKLDLDSTIALVGKGIQGHVRGLQQLGLTIDDTATKEERITQIVEQLNQKFGGQAEAQTKGLGSLILLKAAFENLEVQIGQRLAPAFEVFFKVVSSIFNFIAGNKTILDLATAFIIAGAAISALVLALTTAGTAFITLKAVLAAAKVEVDLMALATRGLVGATGIGLLIIIIAEIALNWNTVWPRAQAVFKAFVDNTLDLLGGFGKVLQGVFTLNFGKLQEGLTQLKETLKKGFAEATKDLKIEPVIEQDPAKKAAADKAAADEARRDSLRIQKARATEEALRLTTEGGSQELIALKQKEADLLGKIEEEKNVNIRLQYEKQLADVQVLEQQGYADQFEQRAVFNQQILEQSQEFQDLDDAQKQAFLIKNRQGLQSQILTENQARQKAAGDRIQIQIKEHNDFLLNQAKFGTAYATISSIMNSAIVQGAAKSFGELASLQQSSNATLKGIGKAAALAQLAIKTAEGAVNIYAGFSAIPIIGPALGIAAAGAFVAYGFEKAGQIQAAAEGGLLQGGIPGVDSIPVLAQQGELVVPNKNFDEVVDAVADKRAGVQQGQAAAQTVSVEVILGLKKNLIDFIETEIVKRKNLNFSIQGVG